MQFLFRARRGSNDGNNVAAAAASSSGGGWGRRCSSLSMAESLASSFGGGSFTSDSGPLEDLEGGGNLVFATDAEMATLMYGDSADDGLDDVIEEEAGGGSGVSVDRGDTIAATRRSSKTSSRRGSDCSARRPASPTTNLASSLPPSATLGKGAFSTVRLAWRRRAPADDDDDDDVDASSHHRRSSQADHRECKTKRRRSIVRVHSNIDDEADDDAGDDTTPGGGRRRDDGGGGELVAVKIIQKSILKQIKTMQKGPNNRLTVHTAFDNIEREIATMKRLRHPNLVRLYEVIDSVESDCLLMVLEYVSLGEILSHVEGTNRYTRMRYRNRVKGLTAGGHFDERHAALYFVDIMHGLAYLHRNSICHRDLKPEVRRVYPGDLVFTCPFRSA